MDYTKETLEAEIVRARARLKALEDLFVAEFGDAPLVPFEPQKQFPYAGLRPIKAVIGYLKEHGESEFETLVNGLIAGGCAMGRRDQAFAIKKSLNFNAKLGKLCVNGHSVKDREVNIGPGDKVSLPA